MRGILGLIALLVVLGVIALSAKQQLQASRAPVPADAAAAASLPASTSVRQFEQNVQDSVTRDIQPRPRADEEH